MTTTIGGSYPSVNSDSDATINGLTVGKGGGALSTNTVVGLNAGVANTTGKITAVGYLAARFNTTGSGNTAVGGNDAAQDGALYLNTTGNYNIAMGTGSVASNTTGSSNTGLGYSALQNNTTASNNTAVGYQAGYSGTTAANNVAVGYQALYTNSTGSGRNTAVGNVAGTALTTATECAFFGDFAGFSVTTGDRNTFLGRAAGYQVTTGNGNTFVGPLSGSNMTTGSRNSILGVFSGNQGGLDIRTASNHIVLSDGDGNPRGYWNNAGIFKVYNNVTANNVAEIVQQNTATGLSFGLKVAGGTNNSDYCLGGDNALGTVALFRFYGDGNMAISNSTATKSSGTTWANPSDIRLKDNIQDYTKGLETLSKVNVKTWEYNGKANTTAGTKGLGVIADEIMQILPNTVDTYASKMNPSDETLTDVKRFDATEITWLLVNAVKELKAEVDSLKQQLGK
jgi:trimeric autotransporter adhesin